MNIEPTGEVLGAVVTGIDLGAPLSEGDFATILQALGDHGVLRFPDQGIDAPELRDFAANFGSLQVLRSGQDPSALPEVSILSNIVRDGKLVGVPDAGQNWHTDMTYNRVPGFVNVLAAFEVPMRDGRPLGATHFANTAAAYDGLPEALKRQLQDATATHDLNFYWEFMRREKASPRAPLSPAERAAHPPSQHPVFLTHPISGRKVIYVNPGLTEKIDGMPEEESRKILNTLFDHVLQPEYRYIHNWAVRDVLLWDHLSTWHNAIADYRPDEPRLIKRCQVMADRIFDPEFVKRALSY